MKDEEIWVKTEELPYFYEISNYGNIRSLDHLDKRKRFCKGKILKLSTNRGGGYPYVRLTFNNKKVSINLHRLVAKYFVDNPENKPDVNHIDSNRTNNYYKNLEWVTHKENMRHGADYGYINNPFGEDARHFKFKVQVVNKDGEIIDTLIGNKDMVEKGYDYRLINAYFTGRQKTHRNCTFNKIYKEEK